MTDFEMGERTPLITRLRDAYEKVGVQVCSGLNPHLFFNFSPSAFTFFFREKELLSSHFGIGLQEVFFLQSLFEVYRPRRILGIGNGWGWSTLACAFLNPEATLVVIDAALDEDSRQGLLLTRDIVSNEGLDVKVLKGTSPEDIPRVVEDCFDGPVDCFLIDGLHTNEAQTRDFESALSHSHPGSLFLFHDVVLFGLQPSLEQVGKKAGLESRILWSTPSGMGAAFGSDFQPSARGVIDAFSPNREMVSRIWRGARVAASNLADELELDQRQLEIFSSWLGSSSPEP